jgi:hypothetical protein
MKTNRFFNSCQHALVASTSTQIYVDIILNRIICVASG